MSLTFLQNTAMAVALTMTTAFGASADATNDAFDPEEHMDMIRERQEALEKKQNPSIAADNRIQDLLQLDKNSDLTELNELLYMESPWIIDIERFDNDNVNDWIDKLYKLTRADPEHPIIIRIQESPGGSAPDGYNFVDALHAVPNPIIGLCAQKSSSMATAMLYSIQNGLRLSTENCLIMSHEVRLNMRIITHTQMKEYRHLTQSAQNRMIYDTSEASGLSIQDSAKLYTSRDIFLNAQEAMGAGLIDAIIPHRKTTDNTLRNRVNGSPAETTSRVTSREQIGAAEYKDAFCLVVQERDFDYCKSNMDEPLLQQAQKTAQTNSLDFN